LEVQVEPSQAGFDPARLARLDQHYERYVEDGRLPGWLLVISRFGKVAHLTACGLRDIEAQLPIEIDTIFRIYSMTKPITSVAAMMLYEEGTFELTTPVSMFIPSFEHARVYVRGSSQKPLTAPVKEPIRIWHLLTHTAGLSYGFLRSHAVDDAYRTAGYEHGFPPDVDLATACDTWAGLPLLFEPGTEWKSRQVNPSISSWPSEYSSLWACVIRAFEFQSRTCRAWLLCTLPSPARQSSLAMMFRVQRCSGRRYCPAAVASSRPRLITSASLKCC